MNVPDVEGNGTYSTMDLEISKKEEIYFIILVKDIKYYGSSIKKNFWKKLNKLKISKYYISYPFY